MGDSRRFTAWGSEYTLTGLNGRAEDIQAGAARVEQLIACRVIAAQKALTSWTGRHAATFATEINGVLARAGDLATALRDRASYLRYFPTGNVYGGYAGPVPVASVAVPGGVDSAVPADLRYYVTTSLVQRSGFQSAANRVHVDGVSGVSHSARPPNPTEREALRDKGWIEADIADYVVEYDRPLDAGNVMEIVELSPVDDLVSPIITAADGLESFVYAVAAAFETADNASLLDLLTLVEPADLAGRPLDALVREVVGRLTTPMGYAELDALMADVTALGAYYPALPAELLRSLGAEGFDTVVASMQVAWDPAQQPNPSGILSVAGEWSLLVARATELGGLTDQEIFDLVYSIDIDALAVTVSGPETFSASFLGPAFDRLWAREISGWSSGLNAILFSGDSRVAALLAANRNEGFAADRLDDDAALRVEVASAGFGDQGAAAAALLENLYYHRVLEHLAHDPPLGGALEVSKQALADFVASGAAWNPGSYEALAYIGTLHFDAMAAQLKTNSANHHSLPAVTDGQLQAFYAQLFGSDPARAITFDHFGPYAQQLLSGDVVGGTYTASTTDLENLRGMMLGALALDETDDRKRRDKGISVLRQGAGHLKPGKLGWVVSLAAGKAIDLIPGPKSEMPKVSQAVDDAYRLAAVGALLDHPDQLARYLPDSGRQDDLRDFYETALAGDPAALAEVDDIVLSSDLEDFVDQVLPTASTP